MQLPEDLQNGVIEALEQAGWNELLNAREVLTDRYRSHQKQQFMTNNQQRLSYLATRLPATYAAVYQTLNQIKKTVNDISIHSLLDLGAGPGTTLWAAAQIFPLQTATLFEKDQALALLGQKLAQRKELAVFQNCQWKIGDLELLKELPVHDMVTLSYSIGELSSASIFPVLQKCWQATKKILVIIEPGTPTGFERMRLIRQTLIDMGGHIVAPCSHALKCPILRGDWCHFTARIERSSFHRRLKGGTLNYEDEKFSYIVVSKSSLLLPPARILRHPQHRSGHSLFTLCTPNGIQQETISKRTPLEYKIAKKLEWGEVFSLSAK
ncbi:Uncharacterized protein PRO82_002060 [Candidatus Protochlamydia amoebophila]|uniref:small ribosomal subunit Rsm22 family protein n=1 Tax=Candidatus Protochlamydia amoebophila TaxID=362787 RepID=UPI001BCA5CAC|nr:small ribosomal subunit Rsm22 family protein [Candidatus Protochlamydia amoebophila]MBS4164729.1 Uncharacterized protein [Candidatus Protochlamydia amoebophila]